MRLEHLNLVVRDLTQTLHFYQAAFPHWSIRGEGHATWHGTPRKWLHFGDDYNYLTLNDSGTGQMRDLATNNLGLAHFAFAVTNLSALIERLQAAGFSVDKSTNDVRHRSSVYYIDPTGYEVEFVEYYSDLPAQRNLYQ